MNATARTTELGLRARAGPPSAESHRTIVVLGDSVVFGTGVADEECIAQRLEDELAAARGDDGARDVICTTAAVPGWNWRNAIGFLESRFDQLRPFVVAAVELSLKLQRHGVRFALLQYVEVEIVRALAPSAEVRPIADVLPRMNAAGNEDSCAT